MSINTLEQAQTTLQSLQESAWILNTLTVIAEANVLAKLQTGASIDELTDSASIPVSILTQALELLTAAGILSHEESRYTLAPGMSALTQKMGLTTLTLQLQSTFGLNREFVTEAHNKKLSVGWHHTDTNLIEAFGTLSRFIANDYIPQDKDLQKLLEQPGAKFLDIGAGCAQISIRLCELYPQVKIVALEPADKPFELAQKHVQASPYADRIELRKIFIQQLTDKNTYDVIWIPQVFLSNDVLHEALPIIWQALKPHGKIFAGALPLEKNDVSYKLRKLLNALFGAARTTEQVASLFEQAHFKDVKIFPEMAGYSLLTAVK